MKGNNYSCIQHSGYHGIIAQESSATVENIGIYVGPWGSPGTNTAVGSHSLPQGTFQTQGLPRITQASCITGIFFTI